MKKWSSVERKGTFQDHRADEEAKHGEPRRSYRLRLGPLALSIPSKVLG